MKVPGQTTTVFVLLAATSILASGISNEVVPVASCRSLSCTPPEGSVCSFASDPEIGVGIAADAVKTGSANLSLTLIDGFNFGSYQLGSNPALAASDQTLFIGLNSAHQNYPRGCALMMQYQGQTFPLEYYPDLNTPVRDSDSYVKNTTSCDGVINQVCQKEISDIIRSFNSSSFQNGGDSNDQCRYLTTYINSRLQQNFELCGESWVNNFINVTGAALPGPNSEPIHSKYIGSGGGNGSCRPVLPQNIDLYRIADMRQYFFLNPPQEAQTFYRSSFGGVAGFTPVIAVIYDQQNSNQSAINFSCMKTYGTGGDPRPDPPSSAAPVHPYGHSRWLAITVLAIGMMLLG